MNTAADQLDHARSTRLRAGAASSQDIRSTLDPNAVLPSGRTVATLTIDYRTFTDKSHLIYIALLAVVIAPGYSRDLLSGGQAQVQLLLDGSDSNTASIAQAYAEGVVAVYGARVRLDAQRLHAGRRNAERRR